MSERAVSNLWERKPEKPPLLMDFPLEIRRVRWSLSLRTPRGVSDGYGTDSSRPTSLISQPAVHVREGIVRAATLPVQTTTLSKVRRKTHPAREEHVHDRSVLNITPAVFFLMDASVNEFRNFLEEACIKDLSSEHMRRERRIAIPWELLYSIWPSRRPQSMSRFMEIMHAITQAGIVEVVLALGSSPIRTDSEEVFAVMANPPPQLHRELVSEDRIRDWALFMYVLGIRGHRSSGDEWIQDDASLIIHSQVAMVDWDVIAGKVYEGVEAFRQSFGDTGYWTMPTFKFRVVATLEETKNWLRRGARTTSWM